MGREGLAIVITFLGLLFSRWGSKNPWCSGKSLELGQPVFISALPLTSYVPQSHPIPDVLIC